jgi:hypothetical protein
VALGVGRPTKHSTAAPGASNTVGSFHLRRYPRRQHDAMKSCSQEYLHQSEEWFREWG